MVVAENEDLAGKSDEGKSRWSLFATWQRQTCNRYVDVYMYICIYIYIYISPSYFQVFGFAGISGGRWCESAKVPKVLLHSFLPPPFPPPPLSPSHVKLARFISLQAEPSSAGKDLWLSMRSKLKVKAAVGQMTGVCTFMFFFR
jgi:hypothetical protein